MEREHVSAVWTAEDRAAAQARGWDIFHTNHDPAIALEIVDGKPYGERPFEVQALDEPPEGAPVTAPAPAASAPSGAPTSY